MNRFFRPDTKVDLLSIHKVKCVCHSIEFHSVQLKAQAMTFDFDITSPDLYYKIILILLRLSGFVFFSSNPVVGQKFRQNWKDFLIFFISLAFSLNQLLRQQENSNVHWKSAVLSGGIVILTRIKLLSALFSKVVNLVAAHTNFDVIRQSKAIDRKVSSYQKFDD